MTLLQLADEEVWKRLQPSKGKTLSALVREGSVTADDAPAIRRMLVAEEAACAPSRSQDRLALIEALLQHYPPRSMQGGETQFWKDWLSDTDGLPVEVLAEACAKWRRSKEKFAPSPGQLLEKVRPDWKYRLKLLRMASEALENDLKKTA
jgi:hypothetical protein